MIPRPQLCTGCRDGEGFDLRFTMAFQPILDLETGELYAFEALVRGMEGQPASTVLGAVTPANLYAFDQACRIKAIETAMMAGLMETPAKLSINFLPNAVYSPEACIRTTLKAAATYSLPLNRLIFEFTEGENMISPEHVRSIIDAYRRIGFGTAIDDFGAGHAGLTLLARFQPDIIKIDMALIRGIEANARLRAIVAGIVSMCRDMKTTVIAEGIETVQEAQTLRDLGIRYMQGFLFAHPAFESLPQAVNPLAHAS